MDQTEKHNQGPIFENCDGVIVKNILPDDDANEAFNEINWNIAGVEWKAEPLETETQEVAVHIPHINNNQYAALGDHEDNIENEDKKENHRKSTVVDNNSDSQECNKTAKLHEQIATIRSRE